MKPLTPFFCLSSFCLLTSLHSAEPTTNSIGIALLLISPGTFTMGQDGPPLEDYLGTKRSNEFWKAKERIDFDEKPAHQVAISQPFFIGVTEVTVAQYRQFDASFRKNDLKAKPLAVCRPKSPRKSSSGSRCPPATPAISAKRGIGRSVSSPS